MKKQDRTTCTRVNVRQRNRRKGGTKAKRGWSGESGKNMKNEMRRRKERERKRVRKHDNENYRGVHRLRRENVSDRGIVSEDITIRNMITRGGWMVTFASDLREDSEEPGETLTERDAEAR